MANLSLDDLGGGNYNVLSPSGKPAAFILHTFAGYETTRIHQKTGESWYLGVFDSPEDALQAVTNSHWRWAISRKVGSMNYKRASLPFGWIITEDHFENSTGTENYSEPKPDDSEYTVKFRLYDDDNNLYYEGLMTPSCEDYYGEGFNNPLDDFGMPNAGCSYMTIKLPGDSGFSIL